MNQNPRLTKRDYLLLLGLLLVTGIGFGLHWSFTIDDAAISFSYARNFASGYGLGALFPGAPRVEGYSNFLWVILLAAGTKLGFDTLVLSKLLGLVFTMGIMALSFLTLHKFVSQKWLLAGLILLPISLTFSFWSASGLENSLYGFLILLSIYFLIEEEVSPQKRLPFASAASLILVGMTRPEGLVYALAGLGYKSLQLFLDWNAQGCRRIRIVHLLVWSGIFIIGYGLFKAWHYWYFAAWWPNPIYAKAGWYRLNLKQVWFEPAGWVYLRGFFRTFGGIWMIPAFIFGGLASLKGPQRIYVLFGLASLALPLYTPDWMINYRFVYPFLPIGAALLILAADQLWNWIFNPALVRSKTVGENKIPAYRSWLRGAGVLLAIFFGLGVAYFTWANLRLTQRQLACGYSTMAETRCLDGRMYWTMSEVDQKYSGLAAIASLLDLNDPLYMIPDIGATSYLQNKRILDLAGLGDYQMARIREGNLLKQYIFQEQRPDIIMTYGIWTRRTDLTTFQAFKENYLPVEQGTDENGMVHGTFIRKDLLVQPQKNMPVSILCEFSPGLFLTRVTTRASNVPNAAIQGFDTFWLTNRPVEEDWSIGITLLDQNGELVFEHTAPFGYGWSSINQWQPDELFRQNIPLPPGLPTDDYTVQVAMQKSTGNTVLQPGCEVELHIPAAEDIRQNFAEQETALFALASSAWRDGDLDNLLASLQQFIDLKRQIGSFPMSPDEGDKEPDAGWHSLAAVLLQAAEESAKQANWERSYKLYLAASLANPSNAWSQHGLEQARRNFLLGSQTGSTAPANFSQQNIANHIAVSTLKD